MPWPGGAVTGGANIAYAFNTNPHLQLPLVPRRRRRAERVGEARRLHIG